MQNELKTKQEKSNIFIKLLTSALAAVFTAVTGYYIYDYLGRENVSIANIEVKQLSFSIEVNRKLKQRIEEYKNERSFVIGFGEIDNYKFMSEQQIKRLLDDLNKDIIKNNDKLSKYNSDYAEVSGIEKLSSELQKQKEQKLKKEYLDESKTVKDSDLRKELLISINEKIKKYSKKKSEHNQLTKDVVTMIYKSIQENTDKFQIEVVLFNSGDKQAVVRYKGQLAIDGTVVNLKRKRNSTSTFVDNQNNQEEFLSNFVIIESKSFNGMTLIVDEYNNRKRDIEYAQREYKAGQKTAVLSIYNIKDQKFQKEKFFFRNALIEEEKESIRNYLMKDFKKYLTPQLTNDF